MKNSSTRTSIKFVILPHKQQKIINYNYNCAITFKLSYKIFIGSCVIIYSIITPWIFWTAVTAKIYMCCDWVLHDVDKLLRPVRYRYRVPSLVRDVKNRWAFACALSVFCSFAEDVSLLWSALKWSSTFADLTSCHTHVCRWSLKILLHSPYCMLTRVFTGSSVVIVTIKRTDRFTHVDCNLVDLGLCQQSSASKLSSFYRPAVITPLQSLS